MTRVSDLPTVGDMQASAPPVGLALSRDRMYGQDLSDLEYVAAILEDPA